MAGAASRLPVGDRCKDGPDCRAPCSRDRVDADGPMNLLDCFNDMNAREREADRGPNALDCWGRADDVATGDRRGKQRLTPEDRRKDGVIQQLPQLRLGIGQTMTERRRIDARPELRAGKERSQAIALLGQ